MREMPYDAQVPALAGGRVGGRPEEAHLPPTTTLPLVVLAHNNIIIIIPSALPVAIMLNSMIPTLRYPVYNYRFLQMG